MQEDVLKAIKIITEGGIVIFPTDTAYGIGCRMDDEDAVRRLFALRRRPEVQATPVLVDGIRMAQSYLDPIPQDVREKLMDKYWPGALTIVLPCNEEKVTGLVRGGGGNLGVRMPNHALILEIIRGIGVPLLGPSANFPGAQTPYALEDLDRELTERVDFIVRGECSVKQASTVIDCSVSPWRILREGAVKVES